MPGVFISYRREDSPGHAGRIFDRVRAKFGTDVVFMDVTAIEAGVDFVEAIEKAVGTCDVLLAVIGPQWSSAADHGGGRRLDSPTDFVRLEIGGALKRQVRVVPVLVDGAQLPAAAALPEELQPLLRRNAIELRDARWDADIDQLIASLARIVKGPEPPLRLERAPARRLRWIAALVVLAVSAGAAIVLGPRGCSSVPGSDIAVAPTAPPAASTPAALAPASAAASPPATRSTSPAAPASPKVIVPDVAGKSLPEAREVLGRAGVQVARVLYRDERTKAVDLVLLQNELRTSAGSPPAVALTVVARAAIMIQHTPQDAEVARGLLGALMSSPATAGLAMRTFETPAVRPNNLARVAYSDSGLASAAADIAMEATAWLQQNAPGRPALTAVVSAPVVSRTMLIGLPDAGATSTSPSTSALPDVRGLGFAEARRALTAAGVRVDVKWQADDKRKALEVVGQETLPGREPGTRVVVLDVVARATLFVEYVESDRARLVRFFSELTETSLKLGILPRLQAVKAVKPVLVGKVFYGDDMQREAASIARFSSAWLTKEQGRAVSIEPATDNTVSSRTLMFGLPKF